MNTHTYVYIWRLGPADQLRERFFLDNDISHMARVRFVS